MDDDAKVGLGSVIFAAIVIIFFAWKASLDTALLEQQNQQLRQENHEAEIKFEYYQRGINER